MLLNRACVTGKAIARILVGRVRWWTLRDLPSIKARGAGGPTTLDVLSDWDSSIHSCWRRQPRFVATLRA